MERARAAQETVGMIAGSKNVVSDGGRSNLQ